MAISPATITRSSVLASMNNTQRGGTAYCATCGRAVGITQGAFSGNYSGRTSGDSYYCATCNQSFTGSVNQARSNNANPTNTYGRSSNSTSSYCPSCNQTASTAHWSGNVATSGSQSSSSYGGLSWVR